MHHESNMDLLSDGRLLKAYKETGDEAAFGELMRRHSRMVLGAARNVLRDASSAEDISQATFLTLARKANVLGDTVSLGGWLYRVAVCLARDELRRVQRRVAREEEAAMMAEQCNAAPTFSEAVVAALHEELGDLSETYRAPIVLHHLECRSYEDAAAALGCNMNTFGPKLTRAREKLRQRLAGRGIALGAGALVAILGQSVSAAELPASIVASTCAAAGSLATGNAVASDVISAKVSALTENALKMLFWAKVKTVAAVCTVAVLVGGAGVGAAVTLPLVLRQDATTASAPTGAGSRVYAWGQNQFGQLGDGTTNNSPIPVSVQGRDGVIAVAAGFAHTVALMSDHTVWAWGGNERGQLGDGTTNNHSRPVPVKTADGVPLSRITAIAAGNGHTVALGDNGTAFAWGDNHAGQLGDGTTNNRSTPVPVSGLHDITAIAAGGSHTMSLKADRTVWTWGSNENGQLGDGTTNNRSSPAPVRLPDGVAPSGIIAIAAGMSHMVALKDDGRVIGWDDDSYGQTGSRATLSASRGLKPLQIGGVSGIIAVSAGSFHTVALKDDTTVWAYGYNGKGQLGTGAGHHNAGQTRMADGSAFSNVTAIAAGSSHTVALKDDTTVWAWGQGYYGQLGAGKIVAGRQYAPVRARMADGSPFSNVTAIAAGGHHTVAIMEKR